MRSTSPAWSGEDAPPSPFDVTASPAPQDFFPLEYLPGGDVEMDQMDVEDYTVPMEIAVTPDTLDRRSMLQNMYAAIPHQVCLLPSVSTVTR